MVQFLWEVVPMSIQRFVGKSAVPQVTALLFICKYTSIQSQKIFEGGDFVILRESGTDAYNPWVSILAIACLLNDVITQPPITALRTDAWKAPHGSKARFTSPLNFYVFFYAPSIYP